MKKLKLNHLSLILIVALLLVGCSNNNKKDVKTSTDTDPTSIVEATVTEAASPTEVVTEETNLALPLATNDSGKLMIQTVSANSTYPTNSYIITSSSGEVIVLDPTQMPSKDIIDLNPAAILSTHGHPDHTDSAFCSSYDCKQVLYTVEDFETNDFHIYTINSSHLGDTLFKNNVIIVLEVDGLRIAHMGDIGQTTLTEEQLTALGTIDIAFMQFENSYSSMDLTNEKGFHLIEQLNPKIIIPTHYTPNALPVASCPRYPGMALP